MRYSKRILVTGATGYIGRQLARFLICRGYRVRVMVRNPSRLWPYDWAKDVETVAADALKPESLSAALSEIGAAYYLLHSLYTGAGFSEKDKEAASNFSRCAAQGGVERIIYLGGPLDPGAEMSEHLRSRLETGEALRVGGVPVTEFRAAIIVGSGSASFEMIRYLGERIPIMVCPRWVFTRTQPIAIGDVLEYLSAALEQPESAGKIIDIGGRDILTYADMMVGYAHSRRLKRLVVPVPVLTPKLSSGWVHWTTPVSSKIARPLIEGLKNETRARNDQAELLFPSIKPIGYSEAVTSALRGLDEGDLDAIYNDALSRVGPELPSVLHVNEQGLTIRRHQVTVKASRDTLFFVCTCLGGRYGWLRWNPLWRLRAFLDRLVGGAGLRRTCPNPGEMRVGDKVDFFEVERFQQGRLLRLRAEFKLPGKAWLQFEVGEQKEGLSTLVVTAFYVPRGLSGFLYWHLLRPLHAIVFTGLVGRLKAEAQAGGPVLRDVLAKR